MQTISMKTINVGLVLLIVAVFSIEHIRTADLMVAVQSDCKRPVSYDKSGDVICPQ